VRGEPRVVMKALEPAGSARRADGPDAVLAKRMPCGTTSVLQLPAARHFKPMDWLYLDA